MDAEIIHHPRFTRPSVFAPGVMERVNRQLEAKRRGWSAEMVRLPLPTKSRERRIRHQTAVAKRARHEQFTAELNARIEARDREDELDSRARSGPAPGATPESILLSALLFTIDENERNSTPEIDVRDTTLSRIRRLLIVMDKAAPEVPRAPLLDAMRILAKVMGY